MTPFIFYIIAIIALDTFAEISAKMWSINKNPLFLAGVVLMFGLAGFLFARSLKYEGMAITNILWVALSVITISLVGYFVFKEQLSLIQTGGIVVVIAGLVMINLK
ncbi:EamA family transporter [Candidatus Peregrinibacteria bacterium]|nr:EamA family transporter [Candidatus Peregrinibacteria bacterium]